MTATSLTHLQRRKADQIVVCMARMVEDGDFLAEGIGTFMSTSAYMLAKHMHAPSCTSLCPNGNTLTQRTRTLTLGHDELDTVPHASLWLDYLQINLHYMPGIFLSGKRWTEFMRPAQIDARGATNNVTIGSHAAPRVRLPGSAGIPDASTAARRFYYYAPRHTRQVFVDTLDFISGAGNADTGGTPDMTITVVSDLGVLITGASGRFEVAQLHDGVTREEIESNTGFTLGWRDNVHTSEPPNDAELHLLNEVIDPQGLRYLEMLSGGARRERLRELAASAASAAAATPTRGRETS
jgi:acyl CoA:acetate/3-ketoacid CoA transferase beta subunit